MKMLAQRRVVPEILDDLPESDPRAIASRRDLTWINALMFQAPVIAAKLRRFAGPNLRILELGCGDGGFLLGVARRTASALPDAHVTLLDRKPAVTDARRRALAELGWRTDIVVADAFDWLPAAPARFDIIACNLFLHHFANDRLRQLLALAGNAGVAFVAAEPRRDAASLAASRMLWAIGANDVTRHDAVASVRAGFTGRELSALWSRRGGPAFRTSRRAVQPRLRRRTRRRRDGMTFDAIVIGAGPGGTAAARRLAAAGRRVALVERAAFPRRKVCGEFLSGSNIAVLARLGVQPEWMRLAGPDVRRVGLFAGERMVAAPMPGAATAILGRALGRDRLDVLLRDAAVAEGATLFQPWRAIAARHRDGLHEVEIAAGMDRQMLAAPVLIAAHGSWEPGTLPSQSGRRAHRPGDLLAFKAHFHGASLADDLMPLFVAPGAYGGLVWADDGRLSLSCCVRRDVLETIRTDMPGSSASEAVQHYLVATCRGVREALAPAHLHGRWLAAGPIRPGFRPGYADGIFRVGNAAGESHPIIAEGIGIAIQSGWMLAGALEGVDLDDADARDAAGRAYCTVWRRQFRTRIIAASAFANVLTRRPAAQVAGRLVAALPGLLTLCATLSGKTRQLAA